MLLVFDNCEHVAEPVARVVSAIAAACPNVKILASSRQPLDVSGEQTYVLPSLDAPLPSRSSPSARAPSTRRFEITDENAAVVADICARLDGIPLAIELAASRAAVLSPKQIAKKLDERFRLLTQKGGDRLPRQQTLRALIDWSYELLDEDERAVFAAARRLRRRLDARRGLGRLRRRRNRRMAGARQPLRTRGEIARRRRAGRRRPALPHAQHDPRIRPRAVGRVRRSRHDRRQTRRATLPPSFANARNSSIASKTSAGSARWRRNSTTSAAH